MATSVTTSVFISYRRRDSSPTSRWLSKTIEQNFGKDSVFIDATAIQAGDQWPKRIEQSLGKSSILLAVIGPEWLKAQDIHSRRRIDDPDDWVHKEILYALRHRLKIIPILVLKAELPALEALPEPLRPLLKHTAFELREAQWETDVGQLLSKLGKLGLRRIRPRFKYPQPSKEVPPLDSRDLKIIKIRLPEWDLVDNRVSLDGNEKIELMRTYEFASFEDAIHFMFAATRHISNIDHHPDWENVWNTITVWLTTWDIGHRPSIYDVELAEYLDELYQDYELANTSEYNKLLPHKGRPRASQRASSRSGRASLTRRK